MLLTLNSFSGIMPRVNEQQLPLGAAVEASDFRTDSACIEPYKNTGVAVATMPGCKTLVIWPTSADRTEDAFIKWDKKIDYCNGISSGYEMIIYTGDGYPKMTEPTPIYIIPKKLDIEKPYDKLVSIDTVSSGVATPHIYETGVFGENSLTSVCYCYTYVDYLGQESEPSPPSEVMDVSSFTAGQGLRLSGFSDSAGTHNNLLDVIRVYRVSYGSSSNDAEFLFIGEKIPTETYFDDYDSSTGTFRSTAEALSTTDWNEPPVDLTGLCSLAGGVLSGYIKGTNDVCFSEPLVQYAWPEKYRLKMPQPILDIKSLGDELVVFMASMVIAIRGEPGYMTVSEVYGGKGTPCITGRGIVKMENGILYPGHDGLYLYNGSSCVNLTVSTMNTLQWRSLLPDKFFGTFYDGKYWAFRESYETAVTIDINNGSVIDINLGSLFPISGIHVDYHGRFWILSGDKAYPWSEGTTSKTGVWQSGLLTFMSHVNLAAAIITSDSPTTENAIQLEIWSHYRGIKTLVFDSVEAGITVPLNRPFRLPGGFMSASVQVRIKTSVTVRDIRFATSMSELGG